MPYTDQIFDGHHQRQAVLTASDNPFAQGLAYIEGEYFPLAEARIPILDQGFLHSDLTYDVPAIWDGRFFRLDDHLDRFWRSMDKLRLKSPMSKQEMRAKLIDMAAKSGIRDAYVQMIVTRGMKFVRQASPDDLTNNVYLIVMPYVWMMPEPLMQTGGSAIVTRTVRRVPPGAIDPTIKNLQWGDFIRGLIEAKDRGSIYPLLTDGDGNLTEGSGYNIILVKNGVLYTPDRGVLEGVTRKSVMELATAMGMEVRMEVVPVEAIYTCDELLVVTTAGGVMPITELDGAPVADGKVGDITKALFKAYWEAHYDAKLSFPIAYQDDASIAAE
jgi:branched-subunit amino acid aminotransferase/4-amino-4-deoxychorismate lyase